MTTIDVTRHCLLVIIIIIVVLLLIIIVIVVIIVICLLLYLSRGFSCWCGASFGLLAICCNFLWWRNDKYTSLMSRVNKTHAWKSNTTWSINATTDHRIFTFSYFSFSLAAFFSNGCLSSEAVPFHISPSLLATSPMLRPGASPFTLGRNSEQKMKKADLGGKKERKNKVIIKHYNMLHSMFTAWVHCPCGADL